MSVDVAGTCRTSEPELVHNQRYSLKLDTAGNLCIVGPTGEESSTIQGTAADGATAVGNPVQVGGVDGSGNVQALSVDTSGKVATNASLAAGEYHAGEVSNPVTLLDVTPVLDTAAYASGDVMFVSTVCTNAFRVTDGLGILDSITLIDKADQGIALDLYFCDVNVTTGAFNAAPSISDAHAASIMAIVPVASGDWKDLGGVKVANIKNIWATIKAASGTRNMYVFAVIGGVGTYTASDLVLRLGILPS